MYVLHKSESFDGGGGQTELFNLMWVDYHLDPAVAVEYLDP
jgi:hypothetical protein